MKRIGLTLIAILLMALSSFAQIINIPGDQSTIQDGIDSATAGDTVLVAEGTYFENINFKGKAITLASLYIMDGDTSHISRTIIDGSQASDPDNATVVRFNSCQDTTSVLNGFTITGGKGKLAQEYDVLHRRAGGIEINTAGGMVINNIIRGNSFSAEPGYISYGGGIFINDVAGFKNIVIRNNTIYDNHITGDTYVQGAGIFVGANRDTVIIDNNRIYRNTATCTGVWKANAGGIQIHTMLPWSTKIVVKNNLIYENEIHCVASHGGAIFLVFHPYSLNRDGRKSGIEIYNNVIANNYSQDKGGGIALWYYPLEGIPGVAAYSDEHPNPLIYNNTIVGNSAAEGAGILNYNTNALLLNNIIWNNSTSGEGEISITTSLDLNFGRFQSYFNIVRGGFPGVLNLDQDPLLNPDDYTPMENSPCVGWGCDSLHVSGNWFQAPESDFLGINRRMASSDHKIDIGALESTYEQIKRPGYDSEHIINVPDEQTTIQAAIDAASDEDTVLVAPWVYYENVDFKGKALSLMSYYGIDGDESHISCTVIDGSLPLIEDSASVVRLVSGEDTTSILKGFTITGGTGTSTTSEGFTNREGGGILLFESGGLIEHNIITDNKIIKSGTDWALGAGISASNDNTRTAIIRNNTITGNTIDSESQSNGGGISLGGANFEVESNQIDNNICETTSSVSYGGGLGWWSFDSPGINPTLRIVNNDIFQNAVTSTSPDINTTGGGMRLISSLSQGKIDILNNRVHDNTSDGFGAGITLAGSTKITMQNNLVCNNICEQAGGGLALFGATSTVIRNNTIFDNGANRGVKSLFLNEGSSVVLFNNILWSGRNKNRKEITSNTEDASNSIYAFHNTIRGGWDVQWNMDVEPEFEKDYHLSETSLCIDRGTDSVEAGGTWYVAPQWDMMGNPRKKMERIDLGALESPYSKVDSFAITSVEIDTATPYCEGVAVVHFTGGIPPFSFYINGEPNDDNSFESLCNGSYELSVKDGDGEVVTTTFDIVTGIDDPVIGDRSLKLYPNPVYDFLTIQTGNPGAFTFEITSLNGQQILVVEMEGTLHQLDLSCFQKGVYFITIRSKEFVATRKIIKL